MLDLQKATFSNRISAFLFDLIIFLVVVVGMSCIVNPLVGYDAKVAELEAIYDEYSERYGIDLELTQEEYDKMTQEEKDAHNAKVEEANKALNEDEEALELYYRIMVLFLFNITVSSLVSYLVLEFAIPLLLGNGQTLGKKIFGIGLMRADGVKITPMQLFVRSILGKYTLETMIPVFVAGMVVTQILGIVGVVVLLGIVVLEAVVYFKSGTNSLIHDLVAVTVCVDIKSQQIFNTEEELIEYKEKMARENAGKLGYGAESASSVYSSAHTVEIDDEASAKIYKEDAEEGSENIPTLTLSTITIGEETYTNTAVAPEVENEEKTSCAEETLDTEVASEEAEAAEETPVEESCEDESSEEEAESEAEDAEEAVDSEKADETEEDETETEESEEN
jgi:uncharacterized RDD family membrane protein YckC